MQRLQPDEGNSRHAQENEENKVCLTSRVEKKLRLTTKYIWIKTSSLFCIPILELLVTFYPIFRATSSTGEELPYELGK